MKNPNPNYKPPMKSNQPTVPIDDWFETILIDAIRYSLGRTSYMPSLVYNYIKPLLPKLSDKFLSISERDIMNYGGYNNDKSAYGDDCDYELWMKFLVNIRKEIDNRK